MSARGVRFEVLVFTAVQVRLAEALEIVVREFEPFCTRHLGFPAEDFLGTRDVRTPLFGVVDRQGLSDHLNVRARERKDFFCELCNRDFIGRPKQNVVI